MNLFRLKRLVRTEHGIAPEGSPLAIGNTSTAFSNGTVGSTYSTVIVGEGGQTPYTAFTVVSGALPGGLALDQSGGLGGTPSTTGTSTFTVQVTDSTGATASKQFVMAVASSGAANPFSITSSTNLSQGVVNTAYSQTIGCTGGVSPYRNFVVVGAGSLPAGLALSSVTGAITGTPSTTVTSTFTVEVTDSTASTVSRAFRLNVISSAAGSDTSAHAFFNGWAASTAIINHWGLRSQSCINAVVDTAPSTTTLYLWPDDSYADPQDAAKMTIVRNDIPGNQQLTFPLNLTSTSFVVCWDFYFGVEFRDFMTPINNYKTFQIRDGAGIWFETRNRWAASSGNDECSNVDVRTYFSQNPLPAGATDQNPYTPTGVGAEAPESYSIKHSVWTRYWAEVRLSQPSSAFTEWLGAGYLGPTGPSSALSGTWHMISLWVADENRDATPILYRVPHTARSASVSQFQFEFDTSSSTRSSTVPMVGYGRNVFVLRGTTDDFASTALFVKPVG